MCAMTATCPASEGTALGGACTAAFVWEGCPQALASGDCAMDSASSANHSDLLQQLGETVRGSQAWLTKRVLALKHENVVVYKQCPEGVSVTTENVDGCSLEEILLELNEGDTLSEQHTAAVLRQVLTGVEYLHANGITHPAVTPANVMLEAETGTIKIGDEDMALLEERSHSEGWADIWGVGCLAAQMLSGEIFAEPENWGIEGGKKPPMPTMISLPAYTFILSCFEEGVGAKDLLEHPFLESATADESHSLADCFDDILLLDDAVRIQKCTRRPAMVPALQPAGGKALFTCPSQTERDRKSCKSPASNASTKRVGSPLPHRSLNEEDFTRSQKRMRLDTSASSSTSAWRQPDVIVAVVDISI